MPGPKFPITEDQIEALVTAFYAHARVDPVLGPVFRKAIGTDANAWRKHEAKIASFWCNAVGLDRSFSGNPMLKHLANPQIVPEQFADWLSLFRRTAEETLPPETAAGIAALSDRIVRSLQMGWINFVRKTDWPRVLPRSCVRGGKSCRQIQPKI